MSYVIGSVSRSIPYPPRTPARQAGQDTDNITVEGEALDDVEVGGVVTHTIIDLLSDESPV